jgi:hypothetical protein
MAWLGATDRKMAVVATRSQWRGWVQPTAKWRSSLLGHNGVAGCNRPQNGGRRYSVTMGWPGTMTAEAVEDGDGRMFTQLARNKPPPVPRHYPTQRLYETKVLSDQ